MRSFFILLAISGLLELDIQSQTPPHQQLLETYDRYREQTIVDRRFKHRDIVPLVENLPDDMAEVRIVGQSVEGREIYLVRIGYGKIKVLLWSQMHGDEPTATMAMMDILNFFRDKQSNLQIKEKLLDELSLFFIPMLNPDGAEKFQRRNALGIDLNRDALRLQTPEALILKRVRDSLQPPWGFNLHDQNRYTSAGLNPQTASLSFLAPAYNEKQEWNETREKAMQLIVSMNNVLQDYLPGKIGRYPDDFEPRAFGDNFQKWGTSTVLIETGGLNDDREKQLLRKMNFIVLIHAFNAIASQTYRAHTLEEYEQIPLNKAVFHDLIIREAKIRRHGKWYTVDVGFRNEEINYQNHNEYYLRSYITDIGDLHTLYGYEEIMASDFEIVPGKVYPNIILNEEILKNLNIQTLLKDGFTHVAMEKLPPVHRRFQFPIQITQPGSKISNTVSIGHNPALLLQKGGVNHIAILNGMPYAITDLGRAVLNPDE